MRGRSATAAAKGHALGNLGNAYARPGPAAAGHRVAPAGPRHRAGNRRPPRRGPRRLGNLGLVYAALGQPQRAIEFYQQTLAIAGRPATAAARGQRPGQPGPRLLLPGPAAAAIGFYQQALVISREIGDRQAEGLDLGNLGNAYYSLGQPQRAIESLEQALRIGQEIKDPNIVGIVSSELDRLRGGESETQTGSGG